MSTTPPDTDTTAPDTTTVTLATTPSKRAALVLTVAGVVLFFVGAVVARVVKSEGDPSMGGDVGDIIKALGMLLGSFGGPFPVPAAVKRALGSAGSKALTMLLVGGALVGGSLIPPGCATYGQSFDVSLEPNGRRPACIVMVRVDGRELAKAYVADCTTFVGDLGGFHIEPAPVSP